MDVVLPIGAGGVSVAVTTVAETVDWIVNRSQQPGFCRVLTLNPEILMRVLQDPEIAALIGGAEKIVPDGIGVVFAMRIIHGMTISRVAGSDIVPALIGAGLKIYLLGGTPESVLAAATRCGPVICGYRDGFWSDAEWRGVQEAIVAAQPDIVLVGMGFPRQEQVLRDLAWVLPRGVGIGVGGVIDMLAGIQRRAPLWIQRIHLEWLYRIACQPGRLRRLGWLPSFLLYLGKIFVRR